MIEIKFKNILKLLVIRNMEKSEQDTWRDGQNNGKGKRKKAKMDRTRELK